MTRGGAGAGGGLWSRVAVLRGGRWWPERGASASPEAGRLFVGPANMACLGPVAIRVPCDSCWDRGVGRSVGPVNATSPVDHSVNRACDYSFSRAGAGRNPESALWQKLLGRGRSSFSRRSRSRSGFGGRGRGGNASRSAAARSGRRRAGNRSASSRSTAGRGGNRSTGNRSAAGRSGGRSTAARGGGRSAAARSRSTAGRGRIAAAITTDLLATDLLATRGLLAAGGRGSAAARSRRRTAVTMTKEQARLSRSGCRQNQRDRTSGSQTEQTIHPDLLEHRTTDVNIWSR